MAHDEDDIRWQIARLKVAELGSVPSTFSSLIRAIRLEGQKSEDHLSHNASSELKRLLRSPATLAPVLAALQEYKANLLSGYKDPHHAVISVFRPDEICALINCIYLTKQVKKRVDADDWNYITEILSKAVTLAGHLGSTIQAIGFEKAVFTTTAQILGITLFSKSNNKQFTNYRRILKKNNSYFDTEEEIKSFNCSGREICSLLAQSIALSSTLASEYLHGLDPAANQRPATATQALTIWLKSLYSKGTAPQEAMDARWYPNKPEVDHIEALTKRINSLSDYHDCWLLAEADSVDTLLDDFSERTGAKNIKENLDLDSSEED